MHVLSSNVFMFTSSMVKDISYFRNYMSTTNL